MPFRPVSKAFGSNGGKSAQLQKCSWHVFCSHRDFEVQNHGPNLGVSSFASGFGDLRASNFGPSRNSGRHLHHRSPSTRRYCIVGYISHAESPRSSAAAFWPYGAESRKPQVNLGLIMAGSSQWQVPCRWGGKALTHITRSLSEPAAQMPVTEMRTSTLLISRVNF